MNDLKTSTSEQMPTFKYAHLLDLYANDIFSQYRQGIPIAKISEWLSEHPRNVPNRRVNLRRWINARLKKIASRSSEFLDQILTTEPLSTAIELGSEHMENAHSTIPAETRSNVAPTAPLKKEMPPPAKAPVPNPKLAEPWLKGKPDKVDLSELIKRSKEQQWPIS